ncbi:hypothetical protein BASA81_014024 [Batrachochytrium salamandrivorans]|nr:hypothetical protein BASA81_014024 [Batrachochytrium salamandrivorans]
MELSQIDPELEAFEKLRVREVSTYEYPSASAFLAKFQSSAASLEPDERIKLVMAYAHEDVESLKTVLSHPQANKICSLEWWYNGKEDVNSIIPLLINNCPELTSLNVRFEHHSEFDFVSSIFEHPSNKLKVLEMPKYAKRGSARFFAALGQSQVSALTLTSSYLPEFTQGLYEYLAKDLLVRLKVRMGEEQATSEMMMSLAQCTRLVELKLTGCEFSQPTAFTLPKSITKLVLHDCQFIGVDWSFLAGSNVRELDLYNVKGVDGNQLGSALADYLRAKGLNKLRFCNCNFINKTLAVVGVELGRIKRFYLESSNLNGTSVELIALALQSPNNEMKELKLEDAYSTMNGINDYLVPALKHPNCNLDKLVLWAYELEHEEATSRVTYTFLKRRALFALLQGKQVRRRSPCPLRRLPVEMFRLVGAMFL